MTARSALWSGFSILNLCLLLCAGNSSAALKVAAAGDISCPASSTARNTLRPGVAKLHPAAEKCQGRRVAKLIKAGKPDVVLALGDLIQGQTSYRDAYADFDRAWGSLGKKIFATVGNHDYYRKNNGNFTASGYFRYWKSKGAPSRRVGKYNRGWTSWNRGKWHMINLNSNCFAADCAFTSRQLKWLARDLKVNRANPKTECTLAYFHHPLFSA
ncbi:MAG: metallophosphoesterase family protein, partial [Solirubrobacterales bacterium]